MKSIAFWFLLLSVLLVGTTCKKRRIPPAGSPTGNLGLPVYQDVPYPQEYSIKYYFSLEQKGFAPVAVSANRDNQVRILSDHGLFVPDNGGLFYPGKFVPDVSYPAVIARKIRAIGTFKDQTFYLDEKQLFSNAWAGKIEMNHTLPEASLFVADPAMNFLISDGHSVIFYNKAGEVLWKGSFEGVIQLKYQEEGNRFLVITNQSVTGLIPGVSAAEIYRGSGITYAEPFRNKVVIGTSGGYLILPEKKIISKVPCQEITVVRDINGELWFGTLSGAFRLNDNGKYSYYAGERWLPGNRVIAIEPGPDQSILILSENGLGKIIRKKITLEEKALFYEKQVREKNIRYGFNCSSVKLVYGYSSAETGPQPSDNLWTAMYLAGQLFRYKVTGSAEARQNAFEAFEAMERLFTVTGIKGLFARGYERDRKPENTKLEGWEKKEYLSGSPASYWLPAADHPDWAWRATASSDQAVGQLFALSTILELADDESWKQRALTCLDNMMEYIVDNDLYIIDPDGKPTLWGRWNPGYVNHFPEKVGDRRLYSSNIIAFLQTAWKFTGKQKYRDKAMELIEKHGYLDNLMRPVSMIGHSDADQLSKLLSEEWNHSDDEMYFLAYPGLYNYAFTPELKEKYRISIKDHWASERPEKNALWNFIYAMTGDKDFDLNESIGFLKQYPLDLRNWSVRNSDRKDIELIPANFRGQTLGELLPLGELPLFRHNGNIFRLDSQGDGNTLISAGDVWLLPYWMGRYIGVISAPVRNTDPDIIAGGQ